MVDLKLHFSLMISSSMFARLKLHSLIIVLFIRITQVPTPSCHAKVIDILITCRDNDAFIREFIDNYYRQLSKQVVYSSNLEVTLSYMQRNLSVSTIWALWDIHASFSTKLDKVDKRKHKWSPTWLTHFCVLWMVRVEYDIDEVSMWHDIHYFI